MRLAHAVDEFVSISPVASLQAAFKPSPNIEAPLRRRVIEGLRRRQGIQDRGLAAAMEDIHPPPAPD